MPVLNDHRLGEPCWIDVVSSDPARAQEFYTALFGWTTTTSGAETGNYVTFFKNGHKVAGLSGPMGDDAAPNAWTTHLKVADADAIQAAAIEAGAQVIAPVMTVGDQGRLAIIADPSGAVFGIWQAAAHTGYELAAAAGAPIWHELNTLDYDAALPFYQSVFDWQPRILSDTAEFRYATFGGDDETSMVGGVYDAKGRLPEGVPSHWQSYLGIEDVDAGALRVAELGGSVIREPWDSEFGRFAMVVDPLGAAFLLGSAPEE